jgi:hypothetical protein
VFFHTRYDLLHVSNGASNSSLVLRAAEVGQTILKVWDKKNPWMADYIPVPVAPALSPATPTLALGSTVCFSTPLVTDKGRRTQGNSALLWAALLLPDHRTPPACSGRTACKLTPFTALK